MGFIYPVSRICWLYKAFILRMKQTPRQMPLTRLERLFSVLPSSTYIADRPPSLNPFQIYSSSAVYSGILSVSAYRSTPCQHHISPKPQISPSPSSSFRSFASLHLILDKKGKGLTVIDRNRARRRLLELIVMVHRGVNRMRGVVVNPAR